MGATILPVFPKALAQSINSPVAFSWKDTVQGLRVNGSAPIADALDKANQYCDGLNQTQQQLLSYVQSAAAVPTPAPPSTVVVTILEVTLVAATTTTINPALPANIGDLLFIFMLAKGATAALAWGANIKFVSATDFDSTTNTTTIFPAVARTDPADSVVRWFRYGIGLTGMT